MRVADIFEEKNIPNYSIALMSTESHKNCVSLAKKIDVTHDSLYEQFKKPLGQNETIKQDILQIAQEQFGGNKVYLLLDDSRISKLHAKDIDGLHFGFDGSTGDTNLGLQMVSALLTDGDIKIPINIEAYITKKISGKNYTSKSELAYAIYSQMINLFNIDTVLADAHYATKYLLSILYDATQQFLMRFTCSRIVQIGRSKGQLRKIFRLRRNEHIRMIQGVFDGKSLCFYVIRLKTGCMAYFVSLLPINIADLEDIYKIRWNIEMFHRTAKQSLGWCDCQMRSIERQLLHSFYVMYSYIIAELLRVKLKLKTTEDAIRALWAAKANAAHNPIYAAGENLC